jgi:hypothetical protein
VVQYLVSFHPLIEEMMTDDQVNKQDTDEKKKSPFDRGQRYKEKSDRHQEYDQPGIGKLFILDLHPLPTTRQTVDGPAQCAGAFDMVDNHHELFPAPIPIPGHGMPFFLTHGNAVSGKTIAKQPLDRFRRNSARLSIFIHGSQAQSIYHAPGFKRRAKLVEYIGTAHLVVTFILPQ